MFCEWMSVKVRVEKVIVFEDGCWIARCRWRDAEIMMDGGIDPEFSKMGQANEAFIFSVSAHREREFMRFLGCDLIYPTGEELSSLVGLPEEVMDGRDMVGWAYKNGVAFSLISIDPSLCYTYEGGSRGMLYKAWKWVGSKLLGVVDGEEAEMDAIKNDIRRVRK